MDEFSKSNNRAMRNLLSILKSLRHPLSHFPDHLCNCMSSISSYTQKLMKINAMKVYFTSRLCKHSFYQENNEQNQCTDAVFSFTSNKISTFSYSTRI